MGLRVVGLRLFELQLVQRRLSVLVLPWWSSAGGAMTCTAGAGAGEACGAAVGAAAAGAAAAGAVAADEAVAPPLSLRLVKQAGMQSPRACDGRGHGGGGGRGSPGSLSDVASVKHCNTHSSCDNVGVGQGFFLSHPAPGAQGKWTETP